YSQIRNNRSWGNLREVYEKNKFIYEEHLNIFIDLTKPVEELWKEVNSKRKNTIRRADKEGTSFAVKNNEDSLKRCYMILKEVYDRAKLPLPSYDFFLNLLLLEKNSRLLIFCAIHEEKIIGCMLAFAYKNTIYDFYAGSMKKFYNKYPNDLIPWQVFKWGKTNGFKVFNFGGAGKPNIPYGVREYKKKFGGSLVNHGRFQKTHQPLLFKISKIGFKLYQKIK
ncbi:MAG: peptidoglycan bridge formation glycyltransferase FemA/FemB family protein, partial [Candidatus Aminicenantes bacterium]|nr:peptidoglycan bridge formation glycyltransferase FemA/FemB family protein [Candidatus Aminicenantes bacterium]